jgi:hypothetical protein
MCGSPGLSRLPPMTFVPHHGVFGVPSPSGALQGRIVRERDPRALSSPSKTTAPSCPSGRGIGGLPTTSRWPAALRLHAGRTPLLGLSKDLPSIDISFACPLPAHLLANEGVRPSALDRHVQDSFRPCRSSRLRRVAPRAALQVCCTLQPIMGFATFQAWRGHLPARRVTRTLARVQPPRATSEPRSPSFPGVATTADVMTGSLLLRLPLPDRRPGRIRVTCGQQRGEYLPNGSGGRSSRDHPRHAGGGWQSEPGSSPGALPFLVTPHPSEPSPRQQPRRVTAALALSPSTRSLPPASSVTAVHRPTLHGPRPQGLAPLASSLSRAVLPRRETRCSLGLASISGHHPALLPRAEARGPPPKRGRTHTRLDYRRTGGARRAHCRPGRPLEPAVPRHRRLRGPTRLLVRAAGSPPPTRRSARAPRHLTSGDRRPLAAPREDWPRSGCGPGGTPFPPGVVSAAPCAFDPLPPPPRCRRSDRAETGSRHAEARRAADARSRSRAPPGPRTGGVSTAGRRRSSAHRGSGTTAEAMEPAPRPAAPERPVEPRRTDSPDPEARLAEPGCPTVWERSEGLDWPPGRGRCSTPQGGERCRGRGASSSRWPLDRSRRPTGGRRPGEAGP